MLVFVSRDIGTGLINGVCRASQYPSQESLDDSSQAVINFYNSLQRPPDRFKETYQAMLDACVALSQGLPVSTFIKGILLKANGPTATSLLVIQQVVNVVKVKAKAVASVLTIAQSKVGSFWNNGHPPNHPIT